MTFLLPPGIKGLKKEKEEEYKKYLKITPECSNELFVLVKDDIIKQITNMRDESTPVDLFSLFFLM